MSDTLGFHMKVQDRKTILSHSKQRKRQVGIPALPIESLDNTLPFLGMQGIGTVTITQSLPI